MNREIFIEAMTKAFSNYELIARLGSKDAKEEFVKNLSEVFDSLQLGVDHAPGHSHGIKGEIVEKLKATLADAEKKACDATFRKDVSMNHFYTGKISGVETALRFLQESSKDSK